MKFRIKLVIHRSCLFCEGPLLWQTCYNGIHSCSGSTCTVPSRIYNCSDVEQVIQAHACVCTYTLNWQNRLVETAKNDMWPGPTNNLNLCIYKSIRLGKSVKRGVGWPFLCHLWHEVQYMCQIILLKSQPCKIKALTPADGQAVLVVCFIPLHFMQETFHQLLSTLVQNICNTRYWKFPL